MKKIFLILILSIVVLFSGCAGINDNPDESNTESTEQVVEKGDTIKIDYVGMYENGTAFGTSLKSAAIERDLYEEGREYRPLEFKVGSNQMIKGIDTGVLGMSEGEQKKMTLPPEDAYGPYRESMVQPVEIEKIRKSPYINNSTNLTSGMEIPIGGGRFGVITDVNETHVTLDANHPFAGKTLIFNVTVVSIEKGNTTSTNSSPN